MEHYRCEEVDGWISAKHWESQGPRRWNIYVRNTLIGYVEDGNIAKMIAQMEMGKEYKVTNVDPK